MMNSLLTDNLLGFDNQASFLNDFLMEDYPIFDREIEECRESTLPFGSQMMKANDDHDGGNNTKRRRNGIEKNVENRDRIAFITKSEIDNLDDGFKWRKYGRKKVKGTPYPRNYYRCATEGCNVKKRIEKVREDSSYVMTTYEGKHNHLTPFIETTHSHGPLTTSSLMATLFGMNI